MDGSRRRWCRRRSWGVDNDPAVHSDDRASDSELSGFEVDVLAAQLGELAESESTPRCEKGHHLESLGHRVDECGEFVERRWLDPVDASGVSSTSDVAGISGDEFVLLDLAEDGPEQGIGMCAQRGATRPWWPPVSSLGLRAKDCSNPGLPPLHQPAAALRVPVLPGYPVHGPGHRGRAIRSKGLFPCRK